ncbi:MAG: carboxyl transferase domain-containing protein [Pseudomonadales bacterium]|jgi:acetyl-CoA carboxylase carboxyltransferase component|nr:carboxyl transferase domain-containing protein [Pseudomonadales bacterium]HJN49872.1 carboxyl transferase domain-containing protein [Pseudomonadales bacterium]|tara:strand:+ start:6833 stop:8515 length:1683 start_codon:yes stop_codon:yes gene_type:complete
MTWTPEMERLKRMRKLGKRMGGAEGIERQKAQGRLTVRERIDLLVDPASFEEVGTVNGVSQYDEADDLVSFRPGSTVSGYGRIEGRSVIVDGQDFTIRGGASDGAIGYRGRNVTAMVQDLRMPLIKLLDGAGGSVRNYDTQNKIGGAASIVHHRADDLDELPVELGVTGVPGSFDLPHHFDSSHIVPSPRDDRLSLLARGNPLAQVPVVSAVLGSVAGGPAVEVGNCHFSIMTKNSETFVGGPPMVKQALGVEMTKQELGNYRVQAKAAGAVHNVAEDEEDAFRQIRRFLSYLPSNVWQLPPRIEPDDDPNRRDEELFSIIPRNRRQTHDVRKLIDIIMDQDSTFEISALYGRALVTMLARIDGFPVAVIANDCRHNGGAMTVTACIKFERFIDFTDTFHLPVVYFCDVPGFMVGLQSEKDGIIRFANRAMFAVREATIPYITIVTRRLYGVASGAAKMNGLGVRYAWPSGESGSLVAEGGVQAAYRRDIEAAADPEAKRKELEERYIRMASVLRQPGLATPMEIIDPRDSRPAIIDYIRKTHAVNATQLGPKIRVGMRP